MDVTQMRELCAGFPGAWPDNPWDHEHPVFKVAPGCRGRTGRPAGRPSQGQRRRRTVSPTMRATTMAM